MPSAADAASTRHNAAPTPDYGRVQYVYSRKDNQLEVAFMKSSTKDDTECDVMQLGVDLTVKDGEIIVPATPPPGNVFDPGGAVVTFGDNQQERLVVERGPKPGSPNHPTSPDDEASWRDLQWIPNLGAELPKNPLNPKWRELVDGRFVLTHGTLVGAKPSDEDAANSVFTFSRKSDGLSFTQAITDRALFTSEIPGDRVIVNMPGARGGVSRIEVRSVKGAPVVLLITGKHPDVPKRLKVGDVITHYCEYYVLMSPVPAFADRLLPAYVGDPGKPLGGNLSPGAYCSGDFYPVP